MHTRISDQISEMVTDSESARTSDSPSVSFKNITFSKKKTIELEPDDIVAIVGPNNSGKSQALRDLKGLFSESYEGTVITDAELDKKFGSLASFRDFVTTNSQLHIDGTTRRLVGYKFNISESRLDSYYDRDLDGIKEVFCTSIETIDRLGDSNTVRSINPQTDQPNHPSHLLLTDDRLELKMSDYFSEAFGQDLILDRASGRDLPLRIGTRVHPEPGQSWWAPDYLEMMRQSSELLEGQGDGMRSFASAILRLLAPATQSILLLDEPEAFLHPAQARVIGQLIATEKRPECQLFVATHSVDVLQGLIDVAPKQLRVLRIQRDGNLNHVEELEKEKVAEISANPLLKYSSVMSGVFHERVIVCEGDSDCMFYSAILDIPSVHGDKRPDVLFVHGNGKQQIWRLVSTLKDLDVPVDVIVDMDVLNNKEIFERIVKSCDGDVEAMIPMSDTIRTAVENTSPALSPAELGEAIQSILDDEAIADDVRALKREINNAIEKASKWTEIKRSGISGLPSGNPTEMFGRLMELCEKTGIWLVPVGTLERFCQSIGGSSGNWIRNVFLEKPDFADDDELNDAREFTKRVWDSR